MVDVIKYAISTWLVVTLLCVHTAIAASQRGKTSIIPKPTINVNSNDTSVLPRSDILQNTLKFLTNQPFNDFDWKLIQVLNKYEKENVVVSPISVKLALGMLYLGIEDVAAKEIEEALNIKSDIKEAVIKTFSSILSSLQQSENNEYDLNIGTKLFLDQSAKILPDFQKKLFDYYNSTLEKVDFKQFTVASNAINNWCSDVTKGKIKQLVNKDDSQDGTVMMLVNAIYFRGEWESQFFEQDTKPDTFFVNNKKKVTTPIMSVKNKFYYYNATELKSHLIRLPYLGKKFAMYLIVPYDIEGLPALSDDIDPVKLSKALERLKEHNVNLKMPKFQFESTTVLGPILKELGIKELFHPSANLDKIGSSPNGPLMVSSILQKSGIDVNEKGAIAHAATEVQIVSRFGEDTVDVSATHPFVFLIADEKNDSIIFIGKIVNPNPQSDIAGGNESVPIVITNRIQPDEPLNPIESALIDKSNYFDKEILKEVVDLVEGNVVLSPASIKSALALLIEGARGKSESELETALRLPDDPEKSRDLLHSNQRALKTKSPIVTLDVQNRIFVADGERLRDDYAQTVRNQYYTDVINLNFINSDKAAKTINDWVNNVTNGLIPWLVQKDDFDASTKIFLTNCIYFKGDWASEFDTKLSKPDCFYPQPDACQKTQFMYGEKEVKYHYSRPLNARMVEIPFKDPRFSMIFMLPDKMDGIYNLLKNLQHHQLTDLFTYLRKHTVQLTLPRTTIEFSSPLSKALQKVDIESIFTTRANLSGILDSINPLSVKDIIHKAKIEINEKGAKAAAASGVQAVLLSAPIKYEFKANHPFLFFIRDTELNGFLFEGLVIYPDKISEGSSIPGSIPTLNRRNSSPSSVQKQKSPLPKSSSTTTKPFNHQTSFTYYR